MTRSRKLIARRPLLSFFILSFGLTWLAWLPFVLSDSGLGLLPWHIPRLGGSAQTLGILPGAYLGPVTSAFLVTALTDGRPGLTRWVRRLVRWRVGLRWYALVLLGVPAAAVAATFVLPRAWDEPHLPPPVMLLSYAALLALQVVTTGLAEEPGWRDFAQPRMQRRFGPLKGSLILGPLWGAWHLPLFFSEWAGWPDVDWAMPVEFVASSTVLSIVLTWVFNRTGESVPLVMLLHANVNTMFSLAWPQIFPRLDAFRDSLHALTISAGLAAVALIVATRGRLGMPRFGELARREPAAAGAPRDGAAGRLPHGGAAAGMPRGGAAAGMPRGGAAAGVPRGGAAAGTAAHGTAAGVPRGGAAGGKAADGTAADGRAVGGYGTTR